MKRFFLVSNVVSLLMLFALISCSMQEERPAKQAGPAEPAPAAPAPVAKAEAKAPAEKSAEKAKVEKNRGDVGLIDSEKNYMILVTKEGKLVTLDFDQKTKVTQIAPTAAKVADIGLGSSVTITYTEEKGKNVATQLEYRSAKGGE